VVFAGFFGYAFVQREPFHQLVVRLAFPAAEGRLVDVGVLVLDVRRRKFLRQRTVRPNALLFVPVSDILLCDFVSLCLHKLALYCVLEGIYADRLLHVFACREYRIGNARYLLFSQTIFFRHRHVGVAYRIEYLLFCQWLYLAASLDYVHTILLKYCIAMPWRKTRPKFNL
jgi:hypothetical protein